MAHLGDLTVSKYSFSGLTEAFKEFRSKSFQVLSLHEKNHKISSTLLQLIQEASPDRFLLIPVMDFIERLESEGVVQHYQFSTFELWLNQYSHLSGEENYRIRGKISGRYVPRDEYQVFFPLGMGKVYPGSHFVTAHTSPDLDTTVASFWGWVDAFSARVSEGIHVWNVPGGAPASQVEVSFLFNNVFGESVFSLLAKSRTTLTVSSLDLMTQEGVVRKLPQDSTLSYESGKGNHATLLVDQEGFYLGEWRSIDIEKVRLVINLLNQCLRWYENNLHVRLVSLFAKDDFRQADLKAFNQAVFGMTLQQCEPAREFTKEQERLIEKYLVEVLDVSQGLQSTIQEFAQAMQKLNLADFQEFILKTKTLENSTLFDSTGKLKENRSHIFTALAAVIESLDRAIYTIRLYVERLDVALKVKTSVLGLPTGHISFRADLEEVKSKIDHFPYLTVTAPEADGKMTPLGVIYAGDLFKSMLGTVSLRDFCNREETKIPSYLEVISVIDHHKSAINTSSPPVAWITDAQSSNALVAELSFSIHDKYSLGGMSLSEIEAQMRKMENNLTAPSHKRILRRLLQRHLVAAQDLPFQVSPERETIEYLQFLYAIMDDTDLLTKVSVRDIECVASLLNRLKSLAEKKEVEIIHFDDIPRDGKFLSKAAKRILQNEEMYSLYRKIYLSKEEAVEENLKLCLKGKPSTIFADTKEQNGCCRIGQTKMFSKNFSYFEKNRLEVLKIWLENAQLVHKGNHEIDLHMHMISTIAGAEDLYSGKEANYKHKDEMWIWIPAQESAVEHLKNFLNAIRQAPHILHNEIDVELLGDNASELKEIFTESFNPVPLKASNKHLPVALFRFKAGTLNSRKAMITPYLPHGM